MLKQGFSVNTATMGGWSYNTLSRFQSLVKSCLLPINFIGCYHVNCMPGGNWVSVVRYLRECGQES